MFKNDGKQVIGVWVFTAYDNGTMDVTQTAPDRARFDDVLTGMRNITKWVAKNMRNRDKCPFSPRNLDEMREAEGDYVPTETEIDNGSDHAATVGKVG